MHWHLSNGNSIRINLKKDSATGFLEHVDFLTTGQNSPPGHPENHLPPDWNPVARGEGADGETRWGSTGLRGPGWSTSGCVCGPAGFRALLWVLETLQGNPGPRSGAPCGGPCVELNAPVLPGPRPAAVLPALPAQRHWTRICFLPCHLPSCAGPGMLPREASPDPPPAACSPRLSPAWLRGSLARCSLSGIPRCGRSNSWQPPPAQSQVLAAGGSAAPGACLKERRMGGDLPAPSQFPGRKREPRSFSASCKKSTSPAPCFNQQ